jgi:hypothetical protein
MSNESRRGPRALSEILGELFTVRGYGRLHARQELENAWNMAVGEVRRGVLDVTVAHSTLLEELAAFRKPALLAALRSDAPATTIHDIRFRVGTVAIDIRPVTVNGSGSTVRAGDTRPASSSAPPRRSVQGSKGAFKRDSDPDATLP